MNKVIITFGTGQRVMQPGDIDQRYRIKVILMADKRPKYWEFNCPKCKAFICELSGDMLSIVDVADITSIPDYQPAPMLIKCQGKFCRLWYEFELLSGR